MKKREKEIKCKHCGECCKRLNFTDKLIISLNTFSFMFSKKCKFLNQDNLCKIYNNRPKICRDWICGVFKK
ncbi:MAG: YkgJ family cysteine cluster protein [Nanoarchaeota archaeon]|nr:YkgJ family cysteine cluster protein [Nanoarchaeota archaeon]MBU1028008.1 YkgJ family cysteine cluster protein [Nanoarchaeota archaeon]